MIPIQPFRRTAAVVALAATLVLAMLGSPSRAEAPVSREVGCFPDNRDADPLGTTGRDLDGAAFKDASITLDKCLSLCAAQGFRFAGVQDGSWCFCGNSYGRYVNGGASCTTKCGGDPTQFCGGEWANNVWEILSTEYELPPPASPVAPSLAPLPPATPNAAATQRFERPELDGTRLDSRPSGAGGFDVVGVAHSFCQRMGFAEMKEYRVADARRTIAIEDGTVFTNGAGSNTTYRFIVCVR